MEQRARRGDRLRPARKAEPFEALDPELFGDDAFTVVGAKHPLFEARFHTLARACHRAIRPSCGGLRKQPRLPGQQNLARSQQLQFVAQPLLGLFSRELRCAKFSCGDIGIGESDGRCSGARAPPPPKNYSPSVRARAGPAPCPA